VRFPLRELDSILLKCTDAWDDALPFCRDGDGPELIVAPQWLWTKFTADVAVERSLTALIERWLPNNKIEAQVTIPIVPTHGSAVQIPRRGMGTRHKKNDFKSVYPMGINQRGLQRWRSSLSSL
jgi:hypothetical protein